MLQKCFRYLIIVACMSLMVACGTTPQKPVIVIDQSTVQKKLVLTDQQKTDYQKALDFLNEQRLTDARSIFQDLIDQEPMLTGAYVNLGVIAKNLNKVDEAQQYLEKALDINPNFIDALLQQALILQDKGEFTRAEELLRRAEAINPDHPLVNYNLGVLYELYLQDYDLAIKHYKRYVNLSTADDVDVVKRWILLLERK